MQQFYTVCSILREADLHNTKNLTPEEKEKRKRMMKRMAALGVVAGAGVTGAELMLHPSSRASLIKAAQKRGVAKKVSGIAKQIWKPMAIGMGADLVIEPTNTAIAQKMEDRLQRKKEAEKNKSKT